jgi:hypothetical protein
VELSLWDKDERELVQGNKVGLAELGHLLGGGVHPGLHPGQFSSVPSGLDRRGETTQHCVLGYYRPELSKLADRLAFLRCNSLSALTRAWPNKIQVAC